MEQWLVDYPHRPLPMPEARYRAALARYKRFRARFPDPRCGPPTSTDARRGCDGPKRLVSGAMTTVERWRVGILVFDGVAALDVAGPFEVLTRARLEPGVESRRAEDQALFDVFTVARTRDPVTATGGLVLVPRHSFADAPRIDLLLVPGGFGTRPLLQDAETIDWIRRTAASARRTASVCTGALLLARAGLLDGRRATTHWGAFGLLASLAQGRPGGPRGAVRRRRCMTSAGVASGMDLALHVVESLFGRAVADETARYIEYRRG